MALLLCDTNDMAAFWIAGELQARGVPVELVTAASLGSAVRWEHRIGCDGATIEITLPDGRVLSNSAPAAVLNRLSFVPTAKLQSVAGVDYSYAVQETHALYLSWLHALKGLVINRPAPQGLGGNPRHPSAWVALAKSAGLPVVPWLQSDCDDPDGAWRTTPGELTAYAVGETAVIPPALPSDFGSGCLTLARKANAMLLGVDFVRRADGRWGVVGASPMPYLISGGAPLADALAALLASPDGAS
jgi:hypothetical protein